MIKPVLLDHRGAPLVRSVTTRVIPIVRARYDAAVADAESRRHWALVDAMSAKAANSKEVRHRLRTRARYETTNNSYAAGMVATLANDVVGVGPRLQMGTPDDQLNRRLEDSWRRWAESIDLAEKLRTMRRSLCVDGEAFGLLTSNDRVPGPVQIDLKLIEADQVSSPYLNPLDPLAVDGIHYDPQGNPLWYDVLKFHPGDMYPIGLIADAIDARYMLHWFRRDRPGQCRGVPEITPALPLYAQLRRYTLAVIAAAETAADFAAVLYSDLPPDGDAADAEPFEHLEIERRMMTTLPAGWKMGQFRAEQPATTYEMFKREILNEIARCLNMPYNVAAGNSSAYNYASGRLDHQVYYRSIDVDRSQLVRYVLDPLLAAWIEEFTLATGTLPAASSSPIAWPHQWFWDGGGHVDPMKEAQAQATRLQNHTTTLADEYARRGQDWEVQIRQRAREVALITELGLPMPLSPAGIPPAPTSQPAPSDQLPEIVDEDEG